MTEVKLQIGSGNYCGGHGVQVIIEGGGINCTTSEHGSFSTGASLTWKSDTLGTCHDKLFQRDLPLLTFKFKTTTGAFEGFCPMSLTIRGDSGNQLYVATSEDISTSGHHDTEEDEKTFIAKRFGRH